MPLQRTRYCFRIARSDHAFGSITEWMSSIAQRPRSQARSYRISFSRSDLRTQLSGVSAATSRAPWTKEDVRALKAHSKSKTPAAEVAKALKRTEGAVRQKAKTIGIGLGHRR